MSNHDERYYIPRRYREGPGVMTPTALIFDHSIPDERVRVYALLTHAADAEGLITTTPFEAAARLGIAPGPFLAIQAALVEKGYLRQERGGLRLLGPGVVS